MREGRSANFRYLQRVDSLQPDWKSCRHRQVKTAESSEDSEGAWSRQACTIVKSSLTDPEHNAWEHALAQLTRCADTLQMKVHLLMKGHLLKEMLARDLPAGGILVNCKENPKIMQRKVPSCLSIKYCYFSWNAYYLFQGNTLPFSGYLPKGLTHCLCIATVGIYKKGRGTIKDFLRSMSM